MDYFDNFDNGLLIKYKKILKMGKKIYRCVLLPLNWWSFKFYAISLSFDSPSKTIKFSCNLFDGLSNDNEITWNLNYHQFKGKRTHL
jgi:hypothetical protein